MPVQIVHHTEDKYLEVAVAGKLVHADYETFVPRVERLIAEHGKLRLLIVLRDFEGWKASALWDDVRFDFKHFRDFERIAIVGETVWEKGMTLFCKPFTTAEIRFFGAGSEAEARAWLAR